MSALDARNEESDNSITRRDIFAIIALCGRLRNLDYYTSNGAVMNLERWAYESADRMEKARAK